MAGDEFTREDYRNGRRKCAHCGELFERCDKRSTFKRGRRGALWFCSDECKHRYEHSAAGEELDPLFGNVMAEGFALMGVVEDADR